MDFSKSMTCIEEKGSDLEKARLRYTLDGIKPHPEATRPFTQLQNQDGGFPCGLVQGNLSTVDNTLSALWWLDELGMLETPSADRAVGYLLAAQKDDGGWDEEPA